MLQQTKFIFLMSSALPGKARLCVRLKTRAHAPFVARLADDTQSKLFNTIK